jgi:cytochrome c biogenesis protein ResB
VAVLSEGADGSPQLVMQGLGPADPVTGESSTLFLVTMPPGVTTDPEVTAAHSISWAGIGAWSGMVVRSDPGQPLIWLAFGLLIVGLVLTFYFPRRRAWALVADDRIALAFLADRYVDQEREFGQLREEVARRSTGQAQA